MQKITPFLWFDHQAEQASHFYSTVFRNSNLGQVTYYGDSGPGPVGSVMTVSFELEGLQFTALNGGPIFKFTPAVSFFVNCATEGELDEIWGKLSAKGSILMTLQSYPFSDKFGWVADHFGVNWQLNLADRVQKIAPFLMFVGQQHGRAEEAIKLYTSIFDNSSINQITRHGPGTDGQPGTVMHAIFHLHGVEFMAIDSQYEHQFEFTEAISFQVSCDSQQEVDYFWDRLGDGGDESAQQCGWLKDRYGLSWQIVPKILLDLLNDPDSQKAKRGTEAMLKIKKIEISCLLEAYSQS